MATLHRHWDYSITIVTLSITKETLCHNNDTPSLLGHSITIKITSSGTHPPGLNDLSKDCQLQPMIPKQSTSYQIYVHSFPSFSTLFCRIWEGLSTSEINFTHNRSRIQILTLLTTLIFYCEWYRLPDSHSHALAIPLWSIAASYPIQTVPKLRSPDIRTIGS